MKRLPNYGSLFCHQGSTFRQVRRFTAYKTMQKRFAGTKPNCDVFTPIMQTMTLFTAARAQPSQHRLPIRIVEKIVSTQDK
jgi:hypothetical protein